jgi:hypothetical protein
LEEKDSTKNTHAIQQAKSIIEQRPPVEEGNENRHFVKKTKVNKDFLNKVDMIKIVEYKNKANLYEVAIVNYCGNQFLSLTKYFITPTGFKARPRAFWIPYGCKEDLIKIITEITP